MASYWTRKGDQEDQDAKTINPWAEHTATGGDELPHPHYHVVCAVIRHPQDSGDQARYLCMQKGETRHPYTTHRWEFPGGKVEPGETPQQALHRELLEEMDYDVQVGPFLCQVTHTYPHFTITMQAYLCQAHTESYTLREHIEGRWCTPAQMATLPWCDADRPILGFLP